MTVPTPDVDPEVWTDPRSNLPPLSADNWQPIKCGSPHDLVREFHEGFMWTTCAAARNSLFADTPTELAAFARQMGLRTQWLQHAGTHREHYDVTDTVRVRAVAAGAVEISYPRDTADLMARKRSAESGPELLLAEIFDPAYPTGQAEAARDNPDSHERLGHDR